METLWKSNNRDNNLLEQLAGEAWLDNSIKTLTKTFKKPESSLKKDGKTPFPGGYRFKKSTLSELQR